MQGIHFPLPLPTFIDVYWNLNFEKKCVVSMVPEPEPHAMA
jgi:hypothetical protein